jgi:hypothetical protein
MVIRCLFWNAFGPRLWLWRQGRSIEYSLAPRWHSHDSVAPLATAQLSRGQLFRCFKSHMTQTHAPDTLTQSPALRPKLGMNIGYSTLRPIPQSHRKTNTVALCRLFRQPIHCRPRRTIRKMDKATNLELLFVLTFFPQSRSCTPHLPRFVTITASPQVFDCLKIPALSRFVNLINQFLQPVGPLPLPPGFVPRQTLWIWPLWINAHCRLPIVVVCSAFTLSAICQRA